MTANPMHDPKSLLDQAHELHPEYRMGNWVDFSTGSTREIYDSMKHFIAVLLRFSQLDESLVYTLQYAISEIFLNAIEHGNRFDPNKKVKGSFVLFDQQLVVKIEDQGSGFIASEVPDPVAKPGQVAQSRELQGKRPGGYGLALARKYMELCYSDDGTRVLLTRDIQK